MASEKIKVTEEMLSLLQLEIKNNFDIETGDIKKINTQFILKKELCCSLQKFKILFISRFNINKNT